MDIRCFKEVDPELYERLMTLNINTYEEKRYRHRQWDKLIVEKGVEIHYFREEQKHRRKRDDATV